MSNPSFDESSVGGAASHEASLPSPQTLPFLPLEGAIKLWWCPLEQTGTAALSLAATLSLEERERAARFGTAALRERYITGRAVLRHLLGMALSMPPSKVPIARGRRGRPVVADAHLIDFNVSHTRGIGVFALGTGLPGHLRIGVDVEHEERPVRVDRLARKLLTPMERQAFLPLSGSERQQRFVRVWTCKEAMSKATGDGLAAPFGAFSVEPGAFPQVLDGPDPYTPGRWRLYRVPMPGAFVVTLAVWQS